MAQRSGQIYAAGFPCLDPDSTKTISIYAVQECCTPTYDYPDTCAFLSTISGDQQELFCVNYGPQFGQSVQSLAPRACAIGYQGSGTNLVVNETVNCGISSGANVDALKCNLVDGSASLQGSASHAMGRQIKRIHLLFVIVVLLAILESWLENDAPRLLLRPTCRIVPMQTSDLYVDNNMGEQK